MRLISDTALAVITIWQEARGESYEGRVAVAEVIRNRMKEHYSSDGTVAGTVCRKWQFSGWNTEDPNRVPSLKVDDDDPIVKDCLKAWQEANTDGTNVAKGATLYLNRAIVPVLPSWVSRSDEVAKIGAHTFYIPRI